LLAAGVLGYYFIDMPLHPSLIMSKDHFFTFEEGITKEWLVTNGQGGYASSTIIGANSRRYHGLLIASFPPHLDRRLILSKIEEVVSYKGEEFYLGVNRYPNTIHPQGHRHLINFRQDPFPLFTYQLKDALLEKEIFMPRNQKTVAVIYRLLEGRGQVSLRLYPFLQCRSHHDLRREDRDYPRLISLKESGFVWTPPELPEAFAMSAPDAGFTLSPDWYYNLQYDRERERGFPFEEDCFCPGYFEGQIVCNFPLALWASCPPPPDPYSTSQIETLYQKEKESKTKLGGGTSGKETAALSLRGAQRRSNLKVGTIYELPLQNRDCFATLAMTAEEALLSAAQNFKGQDGQGNPLVIAGYPWFGHWGRDALVSLPGLFLVNGHFQEAKELLLFLGRHCQEGLIPKSFSEEEGRPDYASADTSLWFIYALHRYIGATGDGETLQNLLPITEEIITAYQKGTSYGINMDQDGLIWAQAPELSLTWMDTPTEAGEAQPLLRAGKAVEVNALWYNALGAYEQLPALAGKKSKGGARRVPSGGNALLSPRHIRALTQRVRENFNQLFWDPRRGYLYDVISPQGADGALRPNQIFSISLPFPVLEEQKWKPVFDQCWGELFTPWGLRSLAPSDPCYRGRYLGDPLQREEAYHQGTIWPWLLGPFFTAFFKIYGRTPPSLKLARELITPLLLHLEDAGLGYISEIFDGDPPHRPKGCIAQAWSVAEVLRVLKEEIKE
jgi:glycogen debranching enzyme